MWWMEAVRVVEQYCGKVMTMMCSPCSSLQRGPWGRVGLEELG